MVQKLMSDIFREVNMETESRIELGYTALQARCWFIRVFYLTTYFFIGSMSFLQTRTWSLVETFGGQNLSTGGLI